MSNSDYASANNFINWLVDLIKTFTEFIKKILGKEVAAAPAENPSA